MRTSTAGLSSLALATGLVMGQASYTSAAAPASSPLAPSDRGAAERPTGSDELPNPLETKRRALKEAVLTGEAQPEWRGGSTAGPVVFDGPLHNSIPEPDRSVDNSTVWQPDSDHGHCRELYFGEGEESLRSYFERQSSGRYSVTGKVAGWVKVPFNEARYGRSSDVKDVDPVVCASVVCSNAQALVTDSITSLLKDYRRQGKTPEQIKASFARFDQQDRYD